MSPKRPLSKLPAPSGIVGLPATQLAEMLDDILAGGPETAPETAAGLLGLAEALHDTLASSLPEGGDEPPPGWAADDLLPELRVVEALLAHLPPERRAPAPTDDRPDRGIAPVPQPPADDAGFDLLRDASVAHDLAAIREALQGLAGPPLPQAVFEEVVALADALTGHADRRLAAATPLKVKVGPSRRHEAAAPEPPAPKPQPADHGPAPPDGDAAGIAAPAPASPLKVKVRPSRRHRAAAGHERAVAAPALPAPPEALEEHQGVPPPAEDAPAPLHAAEPSVAASPEPAAPLKVKVRPSRRHRAAAPAAPAPGPAVAPAVEPQRQVETQVEDYGALLPTEDVAAATKGPDGTSAPPPEAQAQPSATDLGALAPEPRPPAVAEEGEAREPEEDVLLLTEEFTGAGPGDGAPPPVTEDTVPPMAEAEARRLVEEITALADREVVAEAEPLVAAAEARPSPDQPVQPEGSPESADAGTGTLAARIEAIIAANHPSGAVPGMIGGDLGLPARTDALEALLADPLPATDFLALDLLTACWGKGAQSVTSRALLAAAQNLSRNFGLPGKLPMAACRAWKMLDPEFFQAELAQRLDMVGEFIANWQRSQRTFLILEFGEIELIEYLFEALHPADHLDRLANVMNFKVLSNRRMGLLRRVPNRLRKQVQPMLPGRHQDALLLLAHSKALLERIADPNGFAPIVAAADKAMDEVDRLMKQAAAAGAPPLPAPPGGGGMALGRIGG